MMVYIALIVLFILSFYMLLTIKSLKKRIEDTKDSIHNSVSWAKDDLRNDLAGVRSVLKVLAAGGKVTPDMIEEGKPYADLSAADAHQLLTQPGRALVLDVRTHEEYMAGHVPGCKLIPVDELENRLDEVPRDAEPLLVVCQGGGRSAAACEILSKKGFTNLVNIYDGMGAYPGKKEVGISIRPPAMPKS